MLKFPTEEVDEAVGDGILARSRTNILRDFTNYRKRPSTDWRCKPDSWRNRAGFQLNFGMEPHQKRHTEEVFRDNINTTTRKIVTPWFLLWIFCRPPSLSTGLGLSQDTTNWLLQNSALRIGQLGNELENRWEKQDAAIDKCFKLQGHQVGREILQKFGTISYFEDKCILQKLWKKEAKESDINKKNKNLNRDGNDTAFFSRPMHEDNENVINTLKLNLQHVYEWTKQSSKKGCRDSEVVDTDSLAKIAMKRSIRSCVMFDESTSWAYFCYLVN